MVKNGFLFGSQMHLATGIVIVIELIFLIYQIFRCLESPQNQQQKRYFWLLFLLLIYNITSGLFPDQNIGIPIFWQYLFCYGGGLAVSAYIPFYFYKSFALSALGFHIKKGIWLFLIGPFFLFFSIYYISTKDVSTAMNVGMVIPLPYSFILLLAIGRSIYNQYADESLGNLTEIILMFISIFPWGLMAIMSIAGISQLQELILANMGFLFFRLFYVKKGFRATNKVHADIKLKEYVIAEQNIEIANLHRMLFRESSNELFDKNCEKYLTPTQTSVIKMVNSGLTYKQVAHARGVSEDSIKEQMSKIGLRLNVKGKRDILLKLNSEIKDICDNQAIG